MYFCHLFLISYASVKSIPFLPFIGQNPSLQVDSSQAEIPREQFHANMGTIKDRNGMNLTEAEDIKKRWQKYTEELYKVAFKQGLNWWGGLEVEEKHSKVIKQHVKKPGVLLCKL